MTEREPILQHMYTREREGVFRSAEGFDTVAMSPSFDSDRRFVQTVLQPHCTYKAPKELLARSEKRDELFPDATTVVSAPNGALIVGRSVYVGADFTGQRSTTFTHQFIIPEARREEFLKEPERIFQITGFVSRYDIGGGKQLPELQDIAYKAGGVDYDSTLARLGVTEEQFLQLLYAVMASVSTVKGAPKRKVYVSVSSDVSDSSEDAKLLTLLLYKLMPLAFRSALGVTTFNNVPENRQNIHLMFVEKGSISSVDLGLQRNAFFDFDGGHFRNHELPADDISYLDLVWRRRNDNPLLQDMLEFCDAALYGSEGDAILSAPTYDRLCELYQIEQGDYQSYELDRPGHISWIAAFIGDAPGGNNERLIRMLKHLLTRDVDTGFVPDRHYVENIVSVSSDLAAEDRDDAFAMLASLVYNVSQSEDGFEAAWNMLNGLSDQAAAFQQVVLQLLDAQPELIDTYIENKMRGVNSVAALQTQLQVWYDAAPDLWSNAVLIQEAEAAVRRLLHNEHAVIVSVAKQLSYLSAALRGQAEHEVGGELGDCMEKTTAHGLLGALHVERLSAEEWVSLDFFAGIPYSVWRRWQITRPDEHKIWLIQAVYGAMTIQPGADQVCAQSLEDHWDQLGDDLQQARDLLSELLRSRVGDGEFHRISYIFLSGPMTDAESTHRYEAMLKYVHLYGGTEQLGKFIVWAMKDVRLTRGGGTGWLERSLKKYFISHQPSLLRKDKVLRRTLKAVPLKCGQSLTAYVLKETSWLRKLLFRTKTHKPQNLEPSGSLGSRKAKKGKPKPSKSGKRV